MTTEVRAPRIFTLKEAASLVGRHDRSILRAEAEGRIAPARRDELGHRIYGENDIERLRAILAAD